MCLIAWHWQPESSTPLQLLANRDEFYARPALPLHWWEGSTILAGKDLQAGGTWLGVNRDGRLAALTNFRCPEEPRLNTPSRGELVTNFLNSKQSSTQYLQQLASGAADYNPFNLLVFDGNNLLGLESRTATVVTLQPGLGAVSNADFHTPWPKLRRLSDQFEMVLKHHSSKSTKPKTSQLLALLQDQFNVPDDMLPHTGVTPDLERLLAPIFVASPLYGTRASSVISLHTSHIEFTEQTHAASGLSVHKNFTFAQRLGF